MFGLFCNKIFKNEIFYEIIIGKHVNIVSCYKKKKFCTFIFPIFHITYCHNPSPSKSESEVQVKSPSLSPSLKSKSKL